MARPSQMVRRVREGVEQRRFRRQLERSKRKERLGDFKEKVRSATAAPRIEGKATKAELAKLKEEIELAGATTGKGAKAVVRSAVQAGERVGAAIPEDAGIDLSPPELDDPDESPDIMAPSLVFGPNPDDDVPEHEQITFGMDDSPADFDLFTDDDGGSDPVRYF